MSAVDPNIDSAPSVYHIQYGNERFEYHLCYLDSQRHNAIKVHVHPNGHVQVDAPVNTSLQEIKSAVMRRARWIVKHIKDIEERSRYVLPRTWVSGESMFYLGRRYVLKVIKSDENNKSKATCKLKGGQLQVSGYPLTVEQIETATNQWYREKAEDVFNRRIQQWADQLPWVKQTPNFKLREMKTQWGSCSPKGDLMLNPVLVKAPTRCIDYVILHELCHLQEHSHSPRFYSLLDRYMPEWRSIKEHLDNSVNAYKPT